MTSFTTLPDLWRERHRLCEATPRVDSLDEARYVLSTHGGHGSRCLQYACAMRYASELMR